MTEILDYGHVYLDNVYAADLGVVNAARVSYGAHEHTLTEKGVGLINFLMRDHHGTPFEHNFFQFRVKLPIFVVREWHRHRIGWSYNEMSARYTQLPREWYIPEPEHVRTRVGKPGAYTYEPAEDMLAEDFRSELNKSCEDAYVKYEFYLSRGIAPELAREFLHVNHYTEMYASCNARSLMNFLNLRAAPTAQWEIQQYANAIEEYFKKIMPRTWEAFHANGRIAP